MDRHNYDQSVGLDRMTEMVVLGNNACSLHKAGSWNYYSYRKNVNSTIQEGN